MTVPPRIVPLRKTLSRPDSSPLKELSDLQLGLNLADLNRQDEAIAHLKAFVSAHPDDMRAYLALGGVYASKEDFRKAAEEAQAARAPRGVRTRGRRRVLARV